MDGHTPSRKTYRSGCRCRGCRAANAAIERTRYRKVVLGKPRWGQRVAQGETWRRVRALVAEYGSFATVARALQLTNGHVHFYRRPTITLKTYARVARLFRQVHEA